MGLWVREEPVLEGRLKHRAADKGGEVAVLPATQVPCCEFTCRAEQRESVLPWRGIRGTGYGSWEGDGRGAGMRGQ